MKKPGLLKRFFSFGKKNQSEAVEEDKADENLTGNTESISDDMVLAEPAEYSVELPEQAPDEHRPGHQITDSSPKQTKPIDANTQSETEQVSLAKEEIPDELKGRENGLTDADESKTHNEEATGLVPTVTKKELIEAKDKSIGRTHIVTKTEFSREDEPGPDNEQKSSWLKRLSSGLSRSSSQLSDNIAAVFTKRKLDDVALEELEDVLLQADLGYDTTLKIVDSLAKQRLGKNVTDEEVRSIMAEEMEKVLTPVAMPLELDLERKPHVILVVGVNGSGKTTTIGKLSQKLFDSGYSTMLAAGDTFRAAAIEQLIIWGERTGSKVVSRELGSDSAGLAFDAWQTAKDAGSDVLMMDTAGRLQNKTELMAELEKIIRVFKKQDPTAPHTVLLTLDATTGQNALNQVEMFEKVAGVNGLIMTKLDGSARGGILVAISARHKLPVYFVGVGEQVEDLEPFAARDFARSLAGLNS